jgi:uncharacterized protein (TIRG00374 family)
MKIPRTTSHPWIRYGLWLMVPLALAWALRGVSLEAVAQTLGELSLPEVAVLILVNLCVLVALAGRWWALLRGRSYPVPLLLVSAYRLAGFAVSYFTPGTQFGGEPLQVHLLHVRHGIPTTAATASVVLDKAIELAANFAFLGIGLTVVIRLGLQPGGTGLVLQAAALFLLLAPLAYLLAVWHGRRPVSWIAAKAGFGRRPGSRRKKLYRWLLESEHEVGVAARAPGGWVWAILFSILSWFLLLLEWALAMRFLGVAASIPEVVAIVAAVRLAFFIPLPGAVGALEAALLLAFSRLGFNATQALSLAIVIRLRDVGFGALGLWLGGWLARDREAAQDAG